MKRIDDIPTPPQKAQWFDTKEIGRLELLIMLPINLLALTVSSLDDFLSNNTEET